jgi:archaeal type IV pilus assembly protein PilA
MKNFKRSKKALSPVVASIILIAVTVAVSIAVAAWMGALTIGFMQTEEAKITGVQFTGTTVDDKAIVISVANQGTSGLTIVEASVNGEAPVTMSVQLDANEPGTVTIDYNWQVGSNYQVKLATAKGNPFIYNAIA